MDDLQVLNAIAPNRFPGAADSTNGDGAIGIFLAANSNARLVLMAKQRMGSVLVNGSQRQIQVAVNLFGRTTIRVDGLTVYEKIPIQPKSIDFNVIPGKKANLKWRQTPDLKLECSILVDGCATKLAALPESVEEKKAQQKYEQWIFGAAAFVFAAACFWWNYSTIRNDGTYYPKALGIIPSFVAMGIMSFLHPHVNFSPKNRALQVVVGIGAFAIVAFGFTFFTQWFLAAYSHP